jgi:hypothetical protein
MPFDQGAQQVECARADRHRSGFAALAYAEQAATAPVEQEIAEQEASVAGSGEFAVRP